MEMNQRPGKHTPRSVSFSLSGFENVTKQRSLPQKTEDSASKIHGIAAETSKLVSELIHRKNKIISLEQQCDAKDHCNIALKCKISQMQTYILNCGPQSYIAKLPSVRNADPKTTVMDHVHTWLEI